MEALSRIDRTLARLETAIASAALALALLAALYAVLARALRIPASEWLLELPMELLVVAAVFASGALLQEGRHLSVGLFVERLPERWQRRLSMTVTAALALFCAFVAQRAVVAALQASRAGLRLPELFDMPTALPLGVAAFGVSLWCVHLSVKLFR